MIESTANISFLNEAEKLTAKICDISANYSPKAYHVFGRAAAAIFLSPSAACDIAIHAVSILPTVLYSIGSSIYQRKIDFHLPWQHLQRVRNAISPLLFGSVFGFLHPTAGFVMSEPTDKHIVLGMLSSNADQQFETPCSPIHSLSLIEEVASANLYAEKEGIKYEIFSQEHLLLIREAKAFEKSLEILQAQEYIYKITNITLIAMYTILSGIRDSALSKQRKEICNRISVVLVPVLTIVDVTITLVVQTFFLTTGLVRMISGRGPIFTEVTTDPLMHVSFLIQNVLKAIGNLAGSLIWVFSPEKGFKISLLLANTFFQLQMSFLMLKIQIKMFYAGNNSRFAIPILFGNGLCSALEIPTFSMHKTYLLVEKRNHLFNLYWVNRPNVTSRQGLSSKAALTQIAAMLYERFPFMDIEKLMNYPVKSSLPSFPDAMKFIDIKPQGNTTNCVVSNLFGMLETLDQIHEKDQKVSQLRYEVVRDSLAKRYSFYKNSFFPFSSSVSEGYSLTPTWQKVTACHEQPI